MTIIEALTTRLPASSALCLSWLKIPEYFTGIHVVFFFFQLYELYYHLGVAYQHKQDHQKAVEQFSNAIEAVSIAKVNF